MFLSAAPVTASGARPQPKIQPALHRRYNRSRNIVAENVQHNYRRLWSRRAPEAAAHGFTGTFSNLGTSRLDALAARGGALLSHAQPGGGRHRLTDSFLASDRLRVRLLDADLHGGRAALS